MPLHQYYATTLWTGNRGEGTSTYNAYDRSHTVIFEGRVDIQGSSDPDFRGDKAKHSPEDLFVSSLSSCHMLWYLHLCAVNNVIVTAYTDHALGTLEESSNGSGQFTHVTLNPVVIVTQESMVEKANKLHDDAHKMCFIANSVNFPVTHKPLAKVAVSGTV